MKKNIVSMLLIISACSFSQITKAEVPFAGPLNFVLGLVALQPTFDYIISDDYDHSRILHKSQAIDLRQQLDTALINGKITPEQYNLGISRTSRGVDFIEEDLAK